MANTSTSANTELLARFKDTGPSVELIGFASIKLFFAILSQLFCASLIYLTWKSKWLRESYNLLIAANCFCCLIYMFTFGIQFGIAISGTNFIPMHRCALLMSAPIFFMQSQILLFLVLAVDRLITAIFPIWHLKNIQKSRPNTRFYLAIIFGTITTYSSFCVYMAIKHSFNAENSENLTTCSTADPLPTFFSQILLYFNLLSLISYILLWRIVTKKQSSSANFYATKKILKSILTIFFCEFFGWFSNTLIRNLTIWLEVSALQQWYIMNFAGFVLIPSLAMYAPVLYVMSTDYSRAFHKCFGMRFPFSNKTATLSFIDVGAMTKQVVRPPPDKSRKSQLILEW